MGDAGLTLAEAEQPPVVPRMPALGERGTRAFEDAGLIARDAAYGSIVCFCERVTEGEVRDALGSPVPAVDLGGVRRRTRATNGRCQGFFCGAAVAARLASAGEAMSRTVLTVDALVVGAGPAGLAAATAARAGGAGSVVVVDREHEAGGMPRLCAHTGFGLRDLRRVLSGPEYARRWVDRAVASGVDIRTRTMVTGWSEPGRALLTGPGGLFEVDARVVVLATGARERPRAARLVPGSRPAGIFTTGQLQQWVHREHLPVGRRALVVGAEHVSYSAVLTLREAGVRTVALVTEHPRSQTFGVFDLLTRAGLRVPVWTRTTVVGVNGRDRVEQVFVRGPGGGAGGGRRHRRVQRGLHPRLRARPRRRSRHRSGHPRPRLRGRRRDERAGDLRDRQPRAPRRDGGHRGTAGAVRRQPPQRRGSGAEMHGTHVRRSACGWRTRCTGSSRTWLVRRVSRPTGSWSGRGRSWTTPGWM